MGLFDKYRKNNLNESKDWNSAMENNNANIDRLARLRTQVNIDPVMEEVIDSNEKSDKNAKEVFTKLAKDAKDIIPKDPSTGKKVTIKPYTEKLILDESLFDEKPINEEYDPVTKEVIQFLDYKGYDTSDRRVRNYANAVAEYIDMAREALGEYSLEDWYKDTKMNYPEDLKDLKLKESLKEDYNIREYSDQLYSMIEDDMIDAKRIAKDLIYWCSEDDIEKYMRVNDLIFDDEEYDESLEKKSLDEDLAIEPGKTLTSKKGNKITIKSVTPYISEYNGESSMKIKYDYELINGKKGTSICDGKDLFNMLKESLNEDGNDLWNSLSDESEEDDEYTVYDLLNDRLFGYGINKSNFRVKWKFAEVEPTVKTKDGKLKRGYFYPTIHQDDLTTGKSDDRRAFTEDGIGVFVYDEDEASLVKKCAEELNLDFVMKKLVRPHNGFNYIATIKVSDDIQEMPIKDYMESIGKSMSDLLRGKGEKVKSNFKDSANYKSRKNKQDNK